MQRTVLSLSLLALATSGCATKNYGRLQPLSGVERISYTCRDIDLEIAKVGAFQQQIVQGAHFNLASVLGILGDYGIGNNMERGAAEKSATRRLAELNDVKASRGCIGTSISAADQAGAAFGVANASSARVSVDPRDAPGTIDLGGGVKLAPSNSLSGYCIKAATGYIGTGASNRPAVTTARPVCT